MTTAALHPFVPLQEHQLVKTDVAKTPALKVEGSPILEELASPDTSLSTSWTAAPAALSAPQLLGLHSPCRTTALLSEANIAESLTSIESTYSLRARATVQVTQLNDALAVEEVVAIYHPAWSSWPAGCLAASFVAAGVSAVTLPLALIPEADGSVDEGAARAAAAPTYAPAPI